MSQERYRLIRPLGTGNFTAGVFLAEHLDLGREVAVKLLAVTASDDRDELLQEARTMAALDRHENVVQVLDAGDWETDLVYIASEVCRGGSLETMCAPPALPLDPATACSLISKALHGLDFMHREGLLHLDIRPANILLSDGVPKLADFGLSRWLTDAQVPKVYAPHAAPEMLRDYCGSHSADQFAAAMTLAHALTGGNACSMPPSPIDEKTWKAFPALRSSLGWNVPEKLTRVLVRATKFDPADRYTSIELFKRALDQATPAVSFMVAESNLMQSLDGEWSISWASRRSGWRVERQP